MAWRWTGGKPLSKPVTTQFSYDSICANVSLQMLTDYAIL